MAKLKDDFRKEKQKRAARAATAAVEERALEKIINVLDGLDAKSQKRVVKGLASRFGVDNTQKRGTRYPGH